MRIALSQINVTVGNLRANKEKILEYINKAQEEGADMVVFPELTLTGYPPEDLLLKKHFVLENKRYLESLAKEVKDVLAVVGFVDIDKAGYLYNAAALIYKGKVKAIYHKRELPNYGVFDEKRYFKRGETKGLFYFLGLPFGITICEDIWVANGPYLEQANLGAKFILNLSSSPYDLSKLEARRALLKQRVREIKIPICYANLVGGQDELVFDGSSFAVDAKGKIMVSAKEFEEDLVCFDLNIKSVKQNSRWTVIDKKVEKTSTAALKTISHKPLSSLERVHKALVLGTRDYVRKNGFKKVLIGLSGGIDSAVVAALAVEALGKDSVVGVSMPSRFSSEGTRNDAKQLANNLSIEFHEIPIESVYKGYLETLSVVFKGTTPGLAEENIQARIRGNFLMALSNKFGWLVLTTGNKSEIAVGYCTLYGDMSGGYAVIKDVLKTKVYALAQLINKKYGDVIPKSTVERAPTAELRENQKDQDSLPPYDLLDELLVAYVEEHKPFHQMAKKYDKDVIQKVINLVDKSEYKRRQAPPGVKITPRAFGKDWRLPITNKFKEF